MKTYLHQIFFALSTIIVFSFAGCEEKDFSSSRESDEQEMSSLRKEIDKMAEQVSCDNSADWKFVAIGSKACGGATGYIAYSVKIDEALFLKKVAMFNQKQKAFNVKWNMMSDCMAPAPPKTIECVNGKPKLVY